MNNLIIDTGEIALTVNNDNTRVIRFNPRDAIFVERFYNLAGEFESRMTDFQTRAIELGIGDTDPAKESEEQFQAKIKLMTELGNYVRSKIDEVFGEGTSQIAFGNAVTIESFIQFFEGISGYLSANRTDVVKKYTKPVITKSSKSSKRNK